MTVNIRLVATAGLVAVTLNCSSCAASDGAITQEELVRQTQELFDAVPGGNVEPWQKYFATDCLYFDEKGRNMDKPALIADIQPLPAGYSGTIKIGKVSSRIFPDLAILSYDLDETETIFGQNLTARYHQTDTWLRRNSRWQIIASQAFRYYEDPAPGRADPKKFADFTGVYQLGPDKTRKIISEGDHLYLEAKGKREELIPEIADLFFRKGVEGRILFQTDATGKADALVDRRNNEDVVWQKAK